MSETLADIDKPKLQVVLEKIAKEYADKTSQKEVTIIYNMKRKITQAGVSRSILNRYLRGECKASAENAIIVHKCIVEYDSKIQMSDIF